MSGIGESPDGIRRLLVFCYTLVLFVFFMLVSCGTFLSASTVILAQSAIASESKEVPITVGDIEATPTTHRLVEIEKFIAATWGVRKLKSWPYEVNLVILALSTAGLASCIKLMRSLRGGPLSGDCIHYLVLPLYSLSIGLLSLLFLLALPILFGSQQVAPRPAAVIILSAGAGLVPEVIIDWFERIVKSVVSRDPQEKKE